MKFHTIVTKTLIVEVDELFYHFLLHFDNFRNFELVVEDIKIWLNNNHLKAVSVLIEDGFSLLDAQHVFEDIQVFLLLAKTIDVKDYDNVKIVEGKVG